MTEHPNLASALVAALADLTVVEKNRTAKAGAYSYDYADIADCVKATRPVLASHGVVALTPLTSLGDSPAVEVVLIHTSGDERTFGPFPFPHGKDAQATGSMVTYHRRYALLAALGMATGDDDDGAAAQPRESKVEPRTLKSAPANSSSKLNDEQVAAVTLWAGLDAKNKATLKSEFGTIQPARIDAARWPELSKLIGAGDAPIPPGGAATPPASPAPMPFSEEPF